MTVARLRPKNSRNPVSGSMATPSAAMVSSNTRIASGSLSTSTPSQSKTMSPISISAHPVAAIDVQRLGDDVVGIGRGKEHRRAGDNVGRAHAAIGHRFADEALLFADGPVLQGRE